MRGTRIGRWELVAELARGGSGSVWRARDQARREVALKLLLAGRDATHAQRERFLREARALVRLQVWDVATRSLLGTCRVEGLPRALAVDPGGALAALALEGRVELWDLAALCPP